MNFDYQFTAINLIKDHILMLHKTLFDFLKKVNESEKELN